MYIQQHKKSRRNEIHPIIRGYGVISTDSGVHHIYGVSRENSSVFFSAEPLSGITEKFP